VLIEDKSSGPGLRQFLQQWGVPCWPYKPRQDKAQRLHAVSPVLAQGGLFVVESRRPDLKGKPRDWVDPFLEQVCAFAGEGSVEHDEYVDCISSSITYLRDRGMLEATPAVRHIDHEAKVDEDREKAELLYRSQVRREKGNPYG
jgi:predicted phage terminase large subunit-like protein